jgi:NAD(P)-dependent dehydrogenase (short-subunit alcohol dehydrogenase family)
MSTANPSPRLAGKVAIVTGAGSGIGRAEALQLAREGARVVVNDLPRGEPTSAEKVAAEIRAAGGEAVAVNMSVSRMEGAEAIVKAALDAFGRLDILVNNAGFGRIAPVWAMTEAEWDSVIAVNLKGTFAMVKYAAPVFMRQKSGVIVNTSSEAGTGDAYFCSYAAAKEGVAGFTRAVARDLGRYGIRCNAVRPRAFDTGQAKESGYQTLMAFLRRFGRPMSGAYPMGPIPGKSAEVAAIVTWLCTDEAARANGRIFVAGCGEVGLYDEVRPMRAFFNQRGWSVDELSGVGEHLLNDVRNEFINQPEEALKMIDARAATHLERWGRENAELKR